MGVFREVQGYDRSIPGYQRYRIIGDVGRGEHTLQIMDVQLEDAGEYECQVTPVPANNHPLLRRKTELIVLIKPSVPSILYPDVPPPDKQLIISKPDPILRITVLCVAVGGSPPPNFSWILNNQEIPQLKTTPSPRRTAHIQNPWIKLDPVIETQSETGQSRLTLLKSGLKDGDQLMCSVTNAATQLHHDPHQRNLTTHVTIRVHTPPGPPRIISPETDHVYLEGEELKAICVASPPGNPLGGLFWRWLLHPIQVDDPSIGQVSGIGGRGGARLSDYSSVEAYLHTLDAAGSPSGMVGEKTATTTGTYHTLAPISEDVQPLHYTLNKDKDQLVNTLVIPRITRRYHAANQTTTAATAAAGGGGGGGYVSLSLWHTHTLNSETCICVGYVLNVAEEMS
ncbi:unnamed protein product [Echinostoma caproni]|uniref:Ig-like domain-containing protein n=1 Tax=Echinostoma caproni TaxID=27848 RepID=A0A183A622_9TREM|nr:unnamed protein product [Echinostoma caproni]